jgi:hypothetical protein
MVAFCIGSPTCEVCGAPHREGYQQNCPFPTAIRHVPQPVVETPGLGDAVESLLSGMGITQERYGQVKQLFGLPSTCGCTQRKEALNEWGERVRKWWTGE